MIDFWTLLDRSREWQVVSDAEKRTLGLTFDGDGEFWMSFADFKKNYTNIEITNLTPDSLDEGLADYQSKLQFISFCLQTLKDAGK